MTGVEEIQTAIDKLTEFQGLGYFEMNGWLCEEQPGDTIRDSMHPDGGPSPLTNDPAIVTLHRTIDAQLDFLRTARGFYGASITGPELATLFAEHALCLARAINGVTS